MAGYDLIPQDIKRDLRDLRVRLLGGLAFMVAISVLGTVGFHVIDPAAGWVRAFFMTVITLTTVGFGHEVELASSGAYFFTAFLILLGMGGVAYFVTTATAFILEGQLGHVFRKRRMERELSRLSGHLIVCGSGQTALYTARELVSVKRSVVVVAERAEEAERGRNELPDTPVLSGDPSKDEVLILAGVQRAVGLVACTDSDKENLVVTLTARQLNPALRIVSRVMEVEGEPKLRKVGADAVVSPNFIGGLRKASELIRPTVVTFLDTMLRDKDRNLRIDEIRIPAGSPSIGMALNTLGLERIPGALLLAERESDGSWHYNPPRNEKVTPGMVLIFLGSPGDARALDDLRVAVRGDARDALHQLGRDLDLRQHARDHVTHF
ncbi:MAG: potassium channel protein, partial [Gemmatimonadetes bacterium]|nr:potassium channel protein [Gemmatimonadota bacterium]